MVDVFCGGSRRGAQLALLADGDLVRRCRVGDEEAWAELVKRHSGLLRAIARSCGLGLAAADDVVQTTWARAYMSVQRLREPASIRAWLATTARREAIRVRRRELRPVPSEAGDTDWCALDERLLAEERSVAARRAVGRLGESDQQLVGLLFDGRSRSYSEVAAIVGRPVGSIGPTRGRLLRRLARELRANSPDAA
jgi:RNA polymerase sigma factor (sigma-70 family)